jgi:hypothetical protein
VRINAGQDTITIDDVMTDLASMNINMRDQFVRTFKIYAKTVNYTFINDRIVRSSKFKVS